MTGFEDIIFENRNKKYGSYDLRKRYPKHILWGIFLSLFFIFVSAIAIFIVTNSDALFAQKMPKAVTVESLQLADIDEIVFPEPPSAKEAQQKTNLADPEIADSTIEQKEKKVAKAEIVHATDSVDNEGKGKKASDGVANGDSLLYLRVEQMPEFAGGVEGRNRFFRENISQSIINPNNSKNKIRIVVQFTVTRYGEVKDIAVITGATDPAINKEVVRVLSMMRWKPGRVQGGRPSDFRFSMPINI